ncbi:hemophore-related protein [Tsukamurella soli]|uniref:Hemophore-related protein, Rv0203/Rv1174c family n=1 Tax=Tsukamurella soli TaxID=644556 RepID=A0ABP8K4J7_9ACTN
MLTIRRGIATVAIVTCTGLAAPAVANAAPVSPSAPVAGTSCSVAQVERATAKVAPKFWHFISTHPRAKHHFEEFLAKTPAQRKAAFEEMKAKHAAWRKAHPNAAEMHHWKMHHPKVTRAEVHQKLEQIRATCSVS